MIRLPHVKHTNFLANRYLLFVGRIDKEKNVDVVLRAVAIARVAGGFSFCCFRTWGRNREPQASHTETRHRIGSHVHRIRSGQTFADRCMLPLIVLSSPALLNSSASSRWKRWRPACRSLPRVRSRLPELVHPGENGYLFEPGDYKELANRIVELFNDPALRRRMGAKSRGIIADHDINVIMEQFEDFYRTAMERTP